MYQWNGSLWNNRGNVTTAWFCGYVPHVMPQWLVHYSYGMFNQASPPCAKMFKLLTLRRPVYKVWSMCSWSCNACNKLTFSWRCIEMMYIVGTYIRIIGISASLWINRGTWSATVLYSNLHNAREATKWGIVQETMAFLSIACHNIFISCTCVYPQFQKSTDD